MNSSEPHYEIAHQDHVYIMLKDLSNESGSVTVTNAAEKVIEQLQTLHGMDIRFKRVFYIDTKGSVDELLHAFSSLDSLSQFIGFKSGHEGISFGKS